MLPDQTRILQECVITTHFPYNREKSCNNDTV